MLIHTSKPPRAKPPRPDKPAALPGALVTAVTPALQGEAP
jgi:hypothetical protein